MISTTDIFDAASRNPEVYTLRYLGTGLYILHMEDDRNNGLLPQKMNSYGVLKAIDPTWYGMQFAPRNLTKEMADGIEAADAQYDEPVNDEEFCLERPLRVAEEYEESCEVELDSIGELETFEDFANDWEEIESDDGHLELYEDVT
jgi:hypothetical protein